MRLLWARSARDDLIAIRYYIAERNPSAARGVAQHILYAANLLRDQPELGLLTHRPDVRRLLISNTVYSVIYRLRDDDIEILEVFDGRRKAPRTDHLA